MKQLNVAGTELLPGGRHGRHLRVLLVASECSPYIQIGGLGDALRGWAESLALERCDVRVIIPWLEEIISSGSRLVPVREHTLRWSGGQSRFTLLRARDSSRATTYLVRQPTLLRHVHLQPDAHVGITFFCSAVVGLLRENWWQPDVVHVSDMSAGLVAQLSKQQGLRVPVVLTIHNGQYHGTFDPYDARAKKADDPLSRVPSPGAPGARRLNFLRRGILSADVVTTVSPSYAHELKTDARGASGEMLATTLKRARSPLVGILNGVDRDVLDPATDPAIAARFSARDQRGKLSCKEHLRASVGLHTGTGPLFLFLSRLVKQKGLEVLLGAMNDLVAAGGQLIICGDGRESNVRLAQWACDHFPGSCAYRPFRPDQETRYYAGADFFLLPSLWEPCGISQLKALRYGAVPVVRATGGLKDTVHDLGRHPRTGNGFTFNRLTSRALAMGIRRAVQLYGNPGRLAAVRRRGIELVPSWRQAASRYVAIYRSLLATPKAAEKEVQKQ